MSIIAHDLRNPLTALISISEVFDNFYSSMSPNQIKNSIQLLLKSSNHLYKLLENLLKWTRVATGQMIYLPDVLDIKELIDNSLAEIRIQAVVKAIDINVEVAATNSYVICDMNMISTVIRNLVSNAIKFSYRKQSIDIVISEYSIDNAYIQISVIDHGVGIDKDKVNKLFKIGEQITTKGTNREIGSGLGLILCKEFIDKHNCKIWVDSNIDKVTTFSFTLPRSRI